MSVWITRLADAEGGKRMAVKDLFDTAGVRTTQGSKVFEGRVPDTTAEAVRLLEDDGWTSVGKANLHEFAYGITSYNPHYGDVPNPRFPERVAGGSSGGCAAALVTGEADLGLGTDTGGSIRIPAACTETVGFKPTFGAVSMEGCFPLAPSFDHAGPMARDVSTCAAAFRALTGVEPGAVADLGDLHVGVMWSEHAEPEVSQVFQSAVAGVVPRAESVPLALPEDTHAAFQHEVAGTHRDLFAEHADLYGSNVRTKVESCLAVMDAEIAAANAARERYRTHFAEALSGFDVVIAPTLPVVPPRLGADELDVREQMTMLTSPLNGVGAPALALPFGRTSTGLPVSGQVVAKPGEDALVLGAAALVETALRHTALPENETKAD